MTSSASRVPVMCSEFIARTVRTAVPRRVPVSILYPGADLQAFRPDLPTADLRERWGWETGRSSCASAASSLARVKTC